MEIQATDDIVVTQAPAVGVPFVYMRDNKPIDGGIAMTGSRVLRKKGATIKFAEKIDFRRIDRDSKIVRGKSFTRHDVLYEPSAEEKRARQMAMRSERRMAQTIGRALEVQKDQLVDAYGMTPEEAAKMRSKQAQARSDGERQQQEDRLKQAKQEEEPKPDNPVKEVKEEE